MGLPDLFIQLPFTVCQAQWQVLATGRSWIGACPGGTHGLGAGKQMAQQITYNPAWAGILEKQEHRAEGMEQLTPKSPNPKNQSPKS